MTKTTKQERIVNVIRNHGTHNKSLAQLAAYAHVSKKTFVVRCSKLKAKGNFVYEINDGKVNARLFAA